jgi:hypothetical protein
MKTQINIKSAFYGLVVGVLATLAIGAGTYSSATGRYQIATEGNVALVIDTQTGKVWMQSWPTVNGLKNDADFFDPKLVEPKTP